MDTGLSAQHLDNCRFAIQKNVTVRDQGMPVNWNINT